MLKYIEAKLDKAAMAAAQARWDAVAKPLRSLGKLEELIVRIAGIQGTADVALLPRSVLVFCADHGVVVEGVSQSQSDVTALVAQSIAAGESNVSLMARCAGAQAIAVDVGMVYEVDHPALARCTIAKGTANMAHGPAMTRAQAEEAIRIGMELVRERKAQGDRLIAVGEMGIGNTTASTAMACALLGEIPEKLTGRGAGLSDEGLARKRAVIAQAIAVNQPDASDPLDVLAKLGGFEIAAMVGAYLGGAAYRVPIVMDGVISAVAALTAARLCPDCAAFMLPSHMSREAAAAKIIAELKLSPIVHADMALGEGTGAVTLFPLLDMAYSLYSGVHTFTHLGMAAYVPQGGKP